MIDTTSSTKPLLAVSGLTMAYGDKLIQRDLNFTVERGEVLVLMGGSGCGKSSLLRHLIGLQPPAKGEVRYDGEDFYAAPPERQQAMRQRFGVMFQAGALWSSMSVGDNVMMVLREFGPRDARGRPPSDEELRPLAHFKLALVGLGHAFDLSPAALSGGMRKRAAIARAIAVDPPLLFLDEPSAGLDPLTSARLDELILNLRNHLGTTIIMVTHELDSLFAVADRALFLDAKEKTMTALGNPQHLRDHGPAPVRAFLTRGKVAA